MGAALVAVVLLLGVVLLLVVFVIMMFEKVTKMVMMEWRWDDDDGMMDVWTRRMVGMVVAVLVTNSGLGLLITVIR